MNLAAPFRPSSSALLERLASDVDDVMLRHIAEADYAHKADEKLQVLRRIRNDRRVPLPLGLRGARGLSPDAMGDAERCYLTGDFEGENDTVACLLESGHVLRARIMTAIGQLLSWRVQRVGDVPARMFFALGMLFVAVLAEDPTWLPRRDVLELGEWLLAEEPRVRTEWANHVASNDWLLGLTRFDQRHDLWRVLARRMALVDHTNNALTAIVARLTSSSERP